MDPSKGLLGQETSGHAALIGYDHERVAAVPEFRLNKQDNVAIPNILKNINFVSSTSEACRLMKRGGIRIDGEKIDKDYSINTDEFLIQVGKRKFGKIKLT